jgi:hypothetical protein
MIGRAALGCLALAFALAACGEKVQTVSGDKKPDAPGWKGGNPAYNAPGWVASDQAAWEAQLRTRAQKQNDYAIPATTK